MRATLSTPYGWARIDEPDPTLLEIAAATEAGALYAQGYAVGQARLWQLELTRRVVDGTLAAWFGPPAVPTDRFQRDLDLRALAVRERKRDAGTTQARHIAAYVDGVNRALAETRALPFELTLLGCRPRPFTADDVYAIAQLKYFINSAWQFELLHTLCAGHLGAARAAQLFATVADDGTLRDPLPRTDAGAWTDEVAAVVAAGLAGLAHLGLDSPDLGSNAIAIAGAHTASGAPMLAADPHMGHVNPGYNLLCRLTTDDGLAVIGSHFPGAPGIVVGRNRDCAWGMVGLMADNQDLAWGTIDRDATAVEVAGAWQPLTATASTIEVRGAAPVPHVARGGAVGRMLRRRGDHALFLRWPALDAPLGGVCLSELARCHDWPSFQAGLARMTNAPMLTVYADRHGHVGWHAVGLIPRRARPLGSLVRALDDPDHRWDGYLRFDELPGRLEPGGVVAYANQYARAWFDAAPHLSNRWHPPTRAWRIAELLARTSRHDAASLCAVQDDRVDRFIEHHRAFLVALLPPGARLATWDGDTRDVDAALLFERWLAAMVTDLTRRALPPALADRYADAWPGHRWNLLAILRDHAAAWGLDDVPGFARRAYLRALAADDRPAIEFRHSLRRHPLGRLLLSPRWRYDGGSRETLHVARRNTDFLTASQAGRSDAAHYHFGPAFKLVHDLSPAATTHYAIPTPTRGTPLGLTLRRTLARWRRGHRGVTRLR